MAKSLTPKANAKANANARKAYYRALTRLNALPVSTAQDAPCTAHKRYIAALEVYRTSCKWALWQTDKGLYASHTAEFHADYAYAHYTYQVENSNEANA